MKAVENLSRPALVEIVKSLQEQLYLGLTGAEDGETVIEDWDPDHEWSGGDVCEFLAGKLGEHGLVPQFVGDEPEEFRSGLYN